MSRSTPDIAWAPLRVTPLRFRLLLLAGAVVVLVGYVILLLRPLEPTSRDLLATRAFCCWPR